MCWCCSKFSQVFSLSVRVGSFLVFLFVFADMLSNWNLYNNVMGSFSQFYASWLCTERSQYLWIYWPCCSITCHLLEYILTVANLNIWHWLFQTHFILRDLVCKSVSKCTVSFAIPSLYFNPLGCTLVFCLQYILELLLSKWQESSRCICSLIAFTFRWNFAGVEALSHPSSIACSSSCRGLGKNGRQKSKDISQAGRYGGKLFECWFFRKLPQEVEKGGNPGASTMDRYTDGHLQRIGELNSFTFHEKSGDLFLAATAKSDPLLYWNGSYEGAWMFWQAQMCLHMWTWSVTSWKTLFQKMLSTVKFGGQSSLSLTISMPKLRSES